MFPIDVADYVKEDTRPAGGGDELVPTRRTLLERLRDLDDHQSWQEFFDSYWKLIYRAALKSGLPGSEAEDVVQETVIGIARRMGDFRYNPQDCSFKGWLMHVTRRRIIDHLRKRQTGPQMFVPWPMDPEMEEGELEINDSMAQKAFEDVWEAEWQRNLLDAAMERLKQKVSGEHYQIFYLHSVKNMGAREIGKLLGVSTTKVYVVAHRLECRVRRDVRWLSNKQDLHGQSGRD